MTAGGTAPAFGDHVHWADVDGLIFVLDERVGQYYGLGPGDAQLWDRVCAPDRDDDVDRLVQLRAQAAERGWLAADEAAPARKEPRDRPVRDPARWRARLALARAFWLLRRGDFAAAYGWARLASARVAEPAPSPVPLEEALRRFVHAEGWLWSRLGDRDCLPRSLALFVFLRRSGYAVHHHIGLRARPFAAHAWVQHADVALLENRALSGEFTSIATLR